MRLAPAVVYILMRRDRWSVRVVGTDSHFEDEPQVAVTPEGKIIAIGSKAAQAVRDPRYVGSQLRRLAFPTGESPDDELAVAWLAYAIALVRNESHHRFRSFFEFLVPWLRPVLVVHPLSDEIWEQTGNALRRQVAARLLASRVYIWHGRELTDKEITARHFPGDYWVGPTLR